MAGAATKRAARSETRGQTAPMKLGGHLQRYDAPNQAKKKEFYGWTPEIEAKRATSQQARRILQKSKRRRRRDPEEEKQHYLKYREAAIALRHAIEDAKSRV